ncbi:MAG: class II aldolase/adducin family protein [Peptococcaceae bacterium]|jgi:L-ribulose-5-phosphate 4-epimerase|nr:class II aldolase/adducin family protein [Peptococcaceae bacterium]
MFEKEKLAMIKAGMTLDRYGLIALSGGNVSARTDSGELLVTPSGMIYEDMAADDVLVMDLTGKILAGERKPSSDTEAILYIFQQRADIKAIIHTHQPYATAISLIQDEFRADLTTLANAAGGNVAVAPFSPAGSVEMGKDTVNYLGQSRAVILAHHGVMTVGDSLKQALYAAVYLEESAKCYLAAAAVGPTKKLTDPQIQQAVEVFRYVGQGTAAIPESLTRKL